MNRCIIILKLLLQTNNDIIMGIAHNKYNVYGLQFHPESIGTEVGKTILNNYLKLIKYGS